MAWLTSFANLALAAAGVFLFRQLVVFIRRDSEEEIWSKIDTVGVSPGGGAISWAFAIAKSVTSMPETMLDGYQRFSKAHKPFALPTMWMGGALVVLPPSMLHLLNRPRDELSSFKALLDNAQFQYLMTDKDVWANTIHFDIVRKNLAQKHMGPLVAIMAKEWDTAFRKCWGDSEEGHVLNAWDSMVRVIARVALRIMVGTPGCQDENYLELSRVYANAVLVDACFINSLPPAVRPVAGPLIALRARYYQRKLMKVLVPIVRERMDACEEKEGEDDGPVSLFPSPVSIYFDVNF
jgi:hypothetical protein